MRKPHINNICLEDNSGVYLIWFKNNPSKKYYGSTNNVKKRIRAHYWSLKNNRHYSFDFQSDFNDQQDKTFYYNFAIVDIKNALFFENKLINRDPKCYNKNYAICKPKPITQKMIFRKRVRDGIINNKNKLLLS